VCGLEPTGTQNASGGWSWGTDECWGGGSGAWGSVWGGASGDQNTWSGGVCACPLHHIELECNELNNLMKT
jgi:hypothetical protein